MALKVAKGIPKSIIWCLIYAEITAYCKSECKTEAKNDEEKERYESMLHEKWRESVMVQGFILISIGADELIW